MTADEIDQIPAGRYLDMLVARDIFDGKDVSGRYDVNLCPYLEGPRETRNGTSSNFCLLCDEPGGYHDHYHHYSTVIGAAWDVAERLTQNPFGFEFQINVGLAGVWLARVGQWVSEDYSAPLAICRAALKAVQ